MPSRPRALLADVPVGDDSPVVVMGALNVSPESFHPGSVHLAGDDLVAAALAMEEAGAAVVDVGARATAPYLPTAIDEAEEARRLGRAVARLAARLTVPISADTSRPEPARAALEAGARIVNDVRGLVDPAVAALVAERRAAVILMASPATRGPARPSADPVGTVRATLAAALARARAAGIPEQRVVVDPGIGFFRDEAVPWDAWDLRVLAGLGALCDLGRPLVVGVSRKSFLAEVTGRRDPGERLAGSVAAAVVAVLHGAAVVRTHDVAETVDAVRVAERVRAAGAR
jgi:dihydropteroate synthase